MTKGKKKNSSSPSILLVGAGRMGSALLRGLDRERARARRNRRDRAIAFITQIRQAERCGDSQDVADADTRALKACVVALKPQILKTEAARLAGIAKSGALMLSIAAGHEHGKSAQGMGTARAHHARDAQHAGAIGRGISALFAGKNARPSDRKLAQSLLAALGETVWVDREDMIDIVTAVSGSGPAYVFLLVEALAAAAEAEGLPRALAEKLARATIAGSGALLDADPREPGAIAPRRDKPAWHHGSGARDPHGAERPYTIVIRAVAAARARAVALRA
jgi:pyrroline-5-carboxylate reductase